MAATAAVLILASPLLAPQLLAFPYKAETRIGPVWSEQPIDPVAIENIVARTQSLLAESPIAESIERRPIFLTDGKWRWIWLANMSRNSLGLTRPVSDAVILNRADPAEDTIAGGVSGRSMSGVLAHEFTHGILQRRYGFTNMVLQPRWKEEGYADYVAQESRLTAAEVADLKARGEDHPAMVYFEGRQRVTKRLAANGGDVDALFATSE